MSNTPTKVKIQSHEELFNEIKFICAELNGFSALVQNTMEVDLDEIKGLKAGFERNRVKQQEWWKKVIAHIEKCNE